MLLRLMADGCGLLLSFGGTSYWISPLVPVAPGIRRSLTKPFQARELVERAANLIYERRRLRELSQKLVLPQPKEEPIPSADEVFIKRVLEAVERNLADTGFDAEALGKEVAISRAQLYQKLYALTNHTPNDLIKTLRLKWAAELLTKNKLLASTAALRKGTGLLLSNMQQTRERKTRLPRTSLLKPNLL